MYPTHYHAPQSLSEAVELFGQCDDPAFLSGGHTLLPTMKSRLASPTDLIDVRKIAQLHGIDVDDEYVRIGAAETHAAVSRHAGLCKAIPALGLLAGSIGDVQVRHVGTMGGSVANNDPAADYPSAVLALGATVHTSEREIAADDFFDGLYTTCLEPGELITHITFPIPVSAGYAKFRNPASRYALAAVFVAWFGGQSVRVAVTGAGSAGVFRWKAAEKALMNSFGPEALENLSLNPVGLLDDFHGCKDYRAALVQVMAQRAVSNMGGALIE